MRVPHRTSPAWNLLPPALMRILFCNYEYPPLGGGGGVVMAALARQLARRHEVTVLTSRAGDLPPKIDDRACASCACRCSSGASSRSRTSHRCSRICRPASCAALRCGARRLRCRQHALRRADRTARSRARAMASSAERALGSRRRSVRSEQAQLAASARAAACGSALAAAGADDVVGQSRDTVRHVDELYGVQRDGRTDSARHRASAARGRRLARGVRACRRMPSC